MTKCPLCGSEVAERGTICDSCLAKAMTARPGRRQRRLAGAAQSLMVWFAVLLFIKACWMALAEPSYSTFVASMGFPQKSAAVHYLAAAFFGLSAAGYIMAWVGTLLERNWRFGVCGAALAVFGLGQVVTQFMGAQPGDPWAKAVALVVIWMVLPVFQFAALLLGSNRAPSLSSGSQGGAGDAETQSAGA